MVRSQPRQIVCKTLSQKNPIIHKKADGVAHGVGPEFKLRYSKKKKKVPFVLQRGHLSKGQSLGMRGFPFGSLAVFIFLRLLKNKTKQNKKPCCVLDV
jgi:hypothetical protein